MKYQKGFSVLLIVLIVAVILISAGGYFYYKTTPTPQIQEIAKTIVPAIVPPGTPSVVQSVEQKIIEHTSQAVLNANNEQRKQGTDQNIKNNLAGVRSAAQYYYDRKDTNGSYPGNYGLTVTGASGCIAPGSMFTTSPLLKDTNLSDYQSVCNVASGGSAYAVQASLATSDYWCVDSSGQSKAETAPLGTRTVCQ